MRYLKFRCALAISLALALGVTTAVCARSPKQQPPGTEDLSEILAAWSRSSSQINSISTQFARKGKGLGLGSVEYRYTFKWRKSGQAVLDIVEMKRKSKTEPVERLLWTGTGKEVWFYHTYKKEIEVMLPDEVNDYSGFRALMKITPLANWMLGSRFDLIFPALRDPKEFDPLPFLLGFNDVTARKRFRFELLESTDPKRLVIRATPLGSLLKLSYSSVLITLHSERFLPVSLEYHTGRGGREILRYTFLDVAIDPVLADSVFEPRKPDGWRFKAKRD